MNWEQILKEQFGNIILKAKIDNFAGVKSLDVYLDTAEEKVVNEYSQKINDFIDEKFGQNLNFDALTIGTRGEQMDYEIAELDKLINETLEINLLKNVEKNDKLIVKLLENQEDKILVQWNNKGQIRKIEIAKNNIKAIKKHIKF
ncbi:LSm family protein [Mycoplasmopsis iners]|uniref:hypothetical protein n=1 Tax=Mycoplasmopsis iners TaxID=76630 RepID=UPI000495AEB5|nr:hypothetical protein [Mycoplasmopsis iners]